MTLSRLGSCQHARTGAYDVSHDTVPPVAVRNGMFMEAPSAHDPTLRWLKLTRSASLKISSTRRYGRPVFAEMAECENLR